MRRQRILNNISDDLNVSFHQQFFDISMIKMKRKEQATQKKQIRDEVILSIEEIINKIHWFQLCKYKYELFIWVTCDSKIEYQGI